MDLTAKRTLTQTSNTAEVFEYFLTGWGGGLGKLKVSDLSNKDAVVKLVAKDLNLTTIERLISRGTQIESRLPSGSAKLTRKILRVFKEARKLLKTPRRKAPKAPAGPTSPVPPGKVPRMRLTSGADVAQIMTYFLHRYGGKLAEVDLSQLKKKPREVAKLMRAQIDLVRLEILLDRAKVALEKLKNPLSIKRIKFIIPILTIAARVKEDKDPGSPTPPTAKPPTPKPPTSGPTDPGPSEGPEKSYPRMRLTSSASPEQVLMYFLGRFDSRMESLSLADLKRKPLDWSRLLRGSADQAMIQRLVDRAPTAVTKLKDPSSRSLIQAIIPILDGALGEEKAPAPTPPPATPPTPSGGPKTPPEAGLSPAASQEAVLTYFLGRFDPRLEKLTVGDLTGRVAGLAGILRGAVDTSGLKKLLTQANIAGTKLNYAGSRLMLQRILPILEQAVEPVKPPAPTPVAPPTPPTPPGPTPADPQDILAWDDLKLEFFESWGGRLAAVTVKDLADTEKVARLFVAHVSKEGVDALLKEAFEFISSKEKKGRWVQSRLIKVAQILQRAQVLFGQVAPPKTQEEQTIEAVFDILGLPEGLKAPLSEDDLVNFSQDWNTSQPRFGAKVLSMYKLSENLQKLIDMPPAEVSRRYGDGGALIVGLFIAAQEKLVSRMTQAIRLAHPDAPISAGIELSEIGLARYFFTVYGDPLDKGVDFLALNARYGRANVSKLVAETLSTKEITAKTKQAQDLLAYLEKGQLPGTPTRIPIYLGNIFETYNWAGALAKNKGSKGAVSTTKTTPTTPGGRGEGDPDNKAHTPPDDSYFVRLAPPGTTPGEDGPKVQRGWMRHPEDFPPEFIWKKMEEMWARFEPHNWQGSFRSGIGTIASQSLIQLAANGLIDTRTGDQLLKDVGNNLWGRVDPRKVTKTLRAVHDAVKAAKDKPRKEEVSLSQDLRISTGLPTPSQADCRSCFDEAAKLLRASKLPRAAQVLKGPIRFVKPRKGTNVRALGTFYPSKNMVNVQALPRASTELLSTLIHELGHRYHHTIIENKVWQEWLLYTQMLTAPRKPWVGKRVVVSGEMPWSVSQQQNVSLFYGEILEVLGTGYSTKVRVKTDAPAKVGNTALPARNQALTEVTVAWSSLESVRSEIAWDFPTKYSRTNPAEHFAETWAAYHLGVLADDLKAHFEHLLIDREPASNLKIASPHARRIGAAVLTPPREKQQESGEFDINPPEDKLVTMQDLMTPLANAGIRFDSISTNGGGFVLNGLDPRWIDEVESILSIFDATILEGEDGSVQIQVPNFV